MPQPLSLGVDGSSPVYVRKSIRCKTINKMPVHSLWQPVLKEAAERNLNLLAFVYFSTPFSYFWLNLALAPVLLVFCLNVCFGNLFASVLFLLALACILLLLVTVALSLAAVFI